VLLFGIRFQKFRRPLLDSQFQIVVRFAQGLCRPVPLRNVSNDTGDQKPFFCLQRTETDFNWKLATVFALRPKFVAGTHWSRHGSCKVASPMFEVAFSESLRQEYLDQLSQELLPPKAKQPFHLMIHQDDSAFSIDNDNTVRSRLQKQAKLSLRSFCSGAGSLRVGQLRTPSFDRGFACADGVLLRAGLRM
jgi:hypothetical protein